MMTKNNFQLNRCICTLATGDLNIHKEVNKIKRDKNIVNPANAEAIRQVTFQYQLYTFSAPRERDLLASFRMVPYSS